MLKSRIIYIAIVIAAFIFSQALYDSVSLFTLVCVLVLPVLSLILMLICRNFVFIRSKLARGHITRHSTTNLLLEIKCAVPFLSPVMKVNCVINDTQGKENVLRSFVVTFSPFSKTVIEIPVCFAYRGCYDIGIRSLEVYDFLGLFKHQYKVDQFYKLYVMPRHLPCGLRIEQDIYLEEGTSTDMQSTTGYGAELFGVRDYNDSDSLRHVHWNLSAVKDELVVKTYSVNRQKQIYVLMDMTDSEPHTLSSRRLGDAIMEAGLSLCRELQTRVGAVRIMWQSGGLKDYLVTSPAHFSLVYEEAGLCPMQSEQALDRIVGELSHVQALCIITGRLEQDKLSRIELMQNHLCCPIRVLTFENTCSAEASALISKDIALEVISLQALEEGRVMSL